MLPSDFGRNKFGPTKFGGLYDMLLQATETGSGDAAIDTAKCSQGVSIAAGATGHPSTGVYNVTFPTGQYVHWIGGGVDVAAATGPEQLEIHPRNFDASLGTGQIIVVNNAATPALADLPDNSRLYAYFLLGSN